MQVNGSLLKETLLNSTPVDVIGNSKGKDITSEESEKVRVNNLRPSHGFPRTNVEKSYKDTLSSMEEVSQIAQNMVISEHQNLDYIARTVTDGDATAARDRGFLPEHTNAGEYVSVVDKIKINMAIGNDDFKMYGSNISEAEIAKVTGNRGMANKLAKQMASLDVPVNEENINQAMKAVAEGQKLEPLSEGTKKYLIENDVLPTIENLYKAEYGSLNTAKTSVSDELWTQLEGQAVDLIREAGLEANNETIEDAKWLLANELPIEADTLNAKEFYDNLSLPASLEELTDSVAAAMNRGKNPLDAYILGDKLDSRYISSKKVLAEARVLMTAQSVRRMEENGLTPNIKELTKALEDLSRLEREYNKTGETKSDTVTIEDEKFTEVVALTKQVKLLPEYILGQKPGDMTLPELNSKGQAMKASLDKIGEKYETLMTRPRADMGDSINKAFRNIPDILSDLELEVNESNAKAVRILAYNKMPISREAIMDMKTVELQINDTLDKLKPATVLHMIREDKNPLAMTMDELRTEAIAINEANDFLGNEKYSEFLWKLQNTGGISAEERAEFIEIYRNLRSIEKTDGAALGALVGQGGAITIDNLMTAVRSRRKYGTEVAIDDKTPIPVSSEAKYQAILATRIVENITPSDLKEHGEKSNSSLKNSTLEELLETITQRSYAKEVMTGESLELTGEESFARADSEARLNMEYERVRMGRYSMALDSEDEVIKLLTENDIPVNLNNLLAARNLQTKRDTRYERLFRACDAQSLGDIKNQILEKLGESVKAPREMAEAMEALGELAENVMKGMIDAPDANYLNIQTARLIGSEMKLTLDLSKKEYYDIPVIVGDEVAGVSLKIVRGKKDKGKVDVVFDLGADGGKVAAELIVKEKSISGMLAAEERETLRKLQENSEKLFEELNQGELEGKLPEISFIQEENLSIERFMQGERTKTDENDEYYEVQSKQLYGMAKAFLTYVKGSIDR